MLVALSAILVGIAQFFAALISPTAARRLPLSYYRFLLWVLDMKVTVKNPPSYAEPRLIVSNHASYLDIVVLGSLIEGCFVAKSEVATWPFFGQLAKLSRTVFVARDNRREAKEQRDRIAAQMADGDSIILFPEGTSTDGNHVDHFKTSLFSAAEVEQESTGGKPWVQPVTIAYTGLHGMPVGRRQRAVFAWYGDMDLMPHLWQFVQLGASEAQVVFHEPVHADDFPSRKALAAHCEKTISRSLALMLAGRDDGHDQLILGAD